MKGNNTFDKGEAKKLSDNFVSTQFDCHCEYQFCQITLIEPDLIEALEQLWKLAGNFKINSGYRCLQHNQDIKGAKTSQHLMGRAADCESLKGLNGNGLARLAEKVEAFMKGGVGIYSSFCHCDIRKGSARWSLIQC